jgi:kynurenine formamidase
MLKLFCTDTISISNPSFREEGQECHRRFLCLQPYILIMEDADLSHKLLVNRKWRLVLYPLFLDTLDAVPVVALLDDASQE